MCAMVRSGMESTAERIVLRRLGRTSTGSWWRPTAALAIGMSGRSIRISTARAQQPAAAELAAARQLFNEGKEHEKRKRWADALATFKKVAAVKMTPQVRFHIALCEENLGKLVAAINGFELAAEEAAQAGAMASDVAENAPARADALRKRVPVLRLDVRGELGTSRVLLDGAPVAAALVGTNIPVDPGAHTIDLETDGKTVFHKDL